LPNQKRNDKVICLFEKYLLDKGESPVSALLTKDEMKTDSRNHTPLHFAAAEQLLKCTQIDKGESPVSALLTKDEVKAVALELWAKRNVYNVAIVGDKFRWEQFVNFLYDLVGEKIPEEYHKRKSILYQTIPQSDTTWVELVKKGLEESDKQFPNGLPEAEHRYECLWQMYCNIANKGGLSKEMWVNFCLWFGLPTSTSNGSIFDRVSSFLEQYHSYFHGIVADVEEKLATRMDGAYMLRFSGTCGGQFTLSWAAGKKPKNTRIDRKEDGFYYENVKYPSISAIVDRLIIVKAIVTPVPGDFCYRKKQLSAS